MSNDKPMAMRLKSISPTALKLFEESPTEFWIKYLDSGIAKEPQTQPMSIGSGFDAYVKHHIAEVFNLPIHRDRDALFSKQVEPHNQAWCREHAPYVFNEYVQSGSLADLIRVLQGKEIRMEFRADGTINGIPLNGRPDLWFSGNGVNFVYDWKVNGYCSRSPVSPDKGFVMCRRGPSYKGRGTFDTFHDDCLIGDWNGVPVNKTGYIKADWQDQLIIYGWLIGEPFGKEFGIGVDQIACNNKDAINGKPQIRVAQHRAIAKVETQMILMDRLGKMWEAVQAGPSEEILSHIRGLRGDGSEKDDMFQRMCR